MLRTISLSLAAALLAATPALGQNYARMNQYNSALYAAMAQPVSTLVATGNSSAPYTYVRQDVSWQLQNATKGWTLAEAQAVQAALDILPINYLHHARNGGMNAFHRDAGYAHVGVIPAPGAAGVSPPFLGYVSLGDSAFNHNNDGSIYQPGVSSVVCHEVGHQVEWSLGAIWMLKGSAFTPISWDPVAKIPWYGLRSMNLFPTDYGMTNPWEDFADACRLYWFQPNDLYCFSPAKWQFMHDNVFDGIQSPASVRQQVMKIRSFVTPQINALSSGDGDPFSVKGIYGQNWLSMWDGGYTRVTFGGNGAVSSTAISRQTIYAMVPNDQGWQPVQVNTPDGWSNQAGFNVDKPWWQFW
jgi:hypothetical protein